MAFFVCFTARSAARFSDEMDCDTRATAATADTFKKKEATQLNATTHTNIYKEKKARR